MEVNLYNTNKKYNVIYADPPWSYQQWCDKKQGAAKAHYETMKQKDIEELPVERIADKNCILFMWATFPKLQEALATIKAWGFEYKTIGFCWVKRNKNGSWFKGIGFYTKSNSEVCLIATKGKPPKKAAYNAVYNRTTVGVSDIAKGLTAANGNPTASSSTNAPQKKEYSANTYSVCGILMIVLGAVLALLGLILLLAVPVAGIIAVVVGVACVVIGRKYRKVAKERRANE